ncbi:permease [Halobacteria archaeon HArc-gm2]|nr:permease [Halobacteria archaeon HArc-gm2]
MTGTETDGRLFEWYRRIIGEPDSNVDVYLGFALFFGAVGLGLGAFGAGAAGQWVELSDYVAREVAFALGMLAVPTALSSVIVLLPVDRRGLVGGASGVVVCLVAIGLFTYAYPYMWAEGSGPQYSIHVLAVYGVGLTAVLASTGAAMVAYHIDRARPAPADFDPEETEDDAQISDDEIRQDIDEAMADVELTWGGVERHEGTALTLTSDESEFDTSGLQAATTEVHSTGVDEQVSGLRTVKGGEQTTARSETTVDDQTDQLRELRRRRREEASSSDDETFLARLLARVAATFGR